MAQPLPFAGAATRTPKGLSDKQRALTLGVIISRRKQMKRFTKLASIFALALVVLALPAIASAQWRDRDRDDDRYGRNDDDYYRNSRYNRNIRGTIQNLRNRARNFERRIDRIDDRRDDRYGRRDRFDNLEELADRFARATNDLAGEYGNGRNMNNSRDEARRVLDIGSQIDSLMYNTRSNRNGANEWNQISYDLRILADAYGLNYRGGSRNRSGDWRNRVPFPLPF
jgi:hypothetical protein